MGIKNLMSGIAVVIDDALNPDKEDKAAVGEVGEKDKIFTVVERIEEELKIPFYKTHEIPSAPICDNLLQSASFILLDWTLWEKRSSQLKEEGIKKNIEFLKKAKHFFVPVFIFSNEDPSYITNMLPESLYEQNEEKNFIFVKGKSELLKGNIPKLIEDWIQKNASVYTLKAWEQAFYKSKRSLFSSMYEMSPDWPKVFWKSYEKDRVNPSSSMTHLINDVLLGNIKTDIFEEEVFSGTYSPPGGDIRLLMHKASFVEQEKLHEDETRSGDLFELSESEYSINIRPDCDCVPRNGQSINNIELYCIKGQEIGKQKIKNGKYSERNGNFNETINESILFDLHKGKTIRFDFSKLEIEKFSVLKEKRVGRLIHPYITRMQQRYALYLQRQGLPRIPQEAVEDFMGS